VDEQPILIVVCNTAWDPNSIWCSPAYT